MVHWVLLLLLLLLIQNISSASYMKSAASLSSISIMCHQYCTTNDAHANLIRDGDA